MQNCGLCCPGWSQNKTERLWKKDKYFDFARELEKLWDMKMTIIPIVIGTFGIITKRLLKGLEDLEVGGQVDTIQTAVLLRTPEYCEESWRLVETCCHLNSSERLSANADMKNS